MDTRIKLTFKGISYEDHTPQFKLFFDDKELISGYLTESITYNINGNLKPDIYKLQLRLLNKTDEDTKYVNDVMLDKAIQVTDISFNDINCKECLINSRYTTDDGKSFTGQNYISWNGVWELDIEVPVFTYMHKVKNLGWIY